MLSKSYFIKNSLFFGLCLITSSTFAAISQLELFPERGEESVQLQFPYRHLSSEEISKTIFVPENFYTTLNTGGNYQFALVGPLQPCTLIAVKNNQNGKIIIFHKHYTNNMDDCIQKTKDEIDITDLTDKDQIQVYIFTNKTQFYSQFFQDKIENRTQRAELVKISKELKIGLNLSTFGNIRVIFFTSKKGNLELGDYELAELFVFIDTSFGIYNTCPMHEKFFGDFSTAPIAQRSSIVRQIISQQSDCLFQKYFRNKLISENQALTYNSVHFEKIG